MSCDFRLSREICHRPHEYKYINKILYRWFENVNIYLYHDDDNDNSDDDDDDEDDEDDCYCYCYVKQKVVNDDIYKKEE